MPRGKVNDARRWHQRKIPFRPRNNSNYICGFLEKPIKWRVFQNRFYALFLIFEQSSITLSCQKSRKCTRFHESTHGKMLNPLRSSFFTPYTHTRAHNRRQKKLPSRFSPGSYTLKWKTSEHIVVLYEGKSDFTAAGGNLNYGGLIQPVCRCGIHFAVVDVDVVLCSARLSVS